MIGWRLESLGHSANLQICGSSCDDYTYGIRAIRASPNYTFTVCGNFSLRPHFVCETVLLRKSCKSISTTSCPVAPRRSISCSSFYLPPLSSSSQHVLLQQHLSEGSRICTESSCPVIANNSFRNNSFPFTVNSVLSL